MDEGADREQDLRHALQIAEAKFSDRIMQVETTALEFTGYGKRSDAHCAHALTHADTSPGTTCRRTASCR